MKQISLSALIITLTALFLSIATTPANAADDLRSMSSVERSEHLREATNGSTFIVNNIGDAGDSNTNDEICETGSGNGVCTLRAAIEEADSDNDHDIIQFGFTTPVVIKPLDALPEFDTPITIDGVTGNPSTCPVGTTPANLLVTLSGEDITEEVNRFPNGFTVRADADNSVIKGLIITNFRTGIAFGRNVTFLGFQSNTGSDVVCNHIHNNYNAGIRLSGAGSMRIGIENDSGSRNVISGNGRGIESSNIWSSDGGSIQIAENYIGTEVDGTTADGNSEEGIALLFSEPGTSKVVNNVIAFSGEHGIFFGARPSIDQDGGKYTFETNSIYSNQLNGVYVDTDANSENETADLPSLIRNDIYSNGQLGVDIGMVGTDAEAFSSERNRARLLSVGDGKLRFAFISNGDGSPFKLDVFHNDACDDSGFGEGQTWTEQFTISPNSSEVFDTKTLTVGLPAGKFISVLMTNDKGETSEFSNCITEVTTFIVDTSADTLDVGFNGSCKDEDGNCSLRAALQEINNSIDSGPFTVNFGIEPFNGNNKVLRLTKGELPTITKPVLINGNSQPDSRCASVGLGADQDIVLTPLASDGTPHFSSGSGFVLGAGSSGSTIRGLWIEDMPAHAVQVFSNDNRLECNAFDDCGNSCVAVAGNRNTVGGAELFKQNMVLGGAASGVELYSSAGFNSVLNNLIGTTGINVDGNATYGIYLRGTAYNNNIGASGYLNGEDGYDLLGYNYIVGSGSHAIYLEGTGKNNNVGGNYVGVRPDGVVSGNGGIGIFSRLDSTTIGVTRGFANIQFLAPNIIGNNSQGILSQGDDSRITGNFVGVGETGSADIGNDLQAINVTGDNTTVISNTVGYGSTGIEISGDDATIQGNYVGVTISPTLSIPNGTGIFVSGSHSTLSNNVVGNNTGNGIFIAGQQSKLFSNFVGIAPDLSTPIPNTMNGIYNTVNSTLIGDPDDDGAINVIAHNGGHGVAIAGGSNVQVFNAEIRKNGGNGIDVADGANDNYFRRLEMSSNIGKAIDINAGNDMMTAVTVVSADANTDLIVIDFQGAPNTFHYLELYSSDNCADAATGRGDAFLKPGFTFTTNSDGKLSLADRTYSLTNSLYTGNGITALVSNNVAGIPASTSEFSNCVVATGAPPTAVSVQQSAVSYQPGAAMSLFVVVLLTGISITLLVKRRQLKE